MFPGNHMCREHLNSFLLGSVIGKYLGQCRQFREHLLWLQESACLETWPHVVAFICIAQGKALPRSRSDQKLRI